MAEFLRSFWIPQTPLEKVIDLLIGRFGRIVPVASGQGDPLVAAEQFVDGNGMVERGPALGQVGGAARNQKRARSHQRVQFHQIVSGFNERLVSAGAWLAFGGQFAKGTGAFWISDSA